jgi:hypothetical protein
VRRFASNGTLSLSWLGLLSLLTGAGEELSLPSEAGARLKAYLKCAIVHAHTGPIAVIHAILKIVVATVVRRHFFMSI